MEDLAPSDLKTILHSKRANLYYLQYCRLLVKGGRVSYVTDEGRESKYWNIPIANTTSMLLGTGTSITQAAMRELAKAGVLVGFCGGGGTPLFSATDVDVDVAWLSPQSEYRPTEYLQRWVAFWFDDALRLAAAKQFQKARLQRISTLWIDERGLKDAGFACDTKALQEAVARHDAAIDATETTTDLLTLEARLTKNLFKLAVEATDYGDFTRAKRGSGTDPANRFLDHGNYLAYGLAATCCWVLGLPHGLAVLHGKTRRGGLVFDVADLVKDGVILPQAFISAVRGDEEQEFRQACIERLAQVEALDGMIETVQHVANHLSQQAEQARQAAPS